MHYGDKMEDKVGKLGSIFFWIFLYFHPELCIFSNLWITTFYNVRHLRFSSESTTLRTRSTGRSLRSKDAPTNWTRPLTTWLSTTNQLIISAATQLCMHSFLLMDIIYKQLLCTADACYAMLANKTIWYLNI